jgi:hypothetical protein
MSTNPMQRIAELEAKNAALEAENQSLRASRNGNGHVDVGKVVAESFDRFGRLFREDFTGKMAGNITPFIENTIRRCKEVEEKQTTLEQRFSQHEKTVSQSADELASALKTARTDEEKKWKAHRAQMQADFKHVDSFVTWFQTELEKNGKANKDAVIDCQVAVRACNELAIKIGTPVEEIMEYLDKVQSEGENRIWRAAQRFSDTYENLVRPIRRFAIASFVLIAIFMLAMGWIVVKRNEVQLDSNIQQLAEYSEQQKIQMRQLLDQAMDEARESQIENEMKVKMWDAWMGTLTPEQKHDAIDKYRDLVNKAERKRMDDQMILSHQVMEGKRK